MTTEHVSLPRKITNKLWHQAQLSPEQEVCGLLGIKENKISYYPIGNIAEKPQQQFLLDPQQQINAMVTMRENNEQLFAIYHSHPTAPAEPSVTDLAMTTYSDALLLIISLNTKGVLELRGFRVNNQQVAEVTLSLYDGNY